MDFVSIHGYAPDGVNSAGADPTSWNWWADGWTASPAAGVPANVKGFLGYGKKSWMTETSGENTAWLSPASGYPNAGAFSLAVKLHQALTTGRQSGWAYWQFTDGNPVGTQTLTDATARATSPKYVAVKHFFSAVRPGAVRVSATVNSSASPTLLASSYVHDADYSLAVVLVNPTGSTVSTTVQVPSYPRGLASFQCAVSSDGSYWQTSRVTVNDGQAVVAVPGYGVATLYGVGLNPDASSAVGVPTVSRGTDGRCQIVFHRDAARLELSFVVEASNELTTGAWTSLATSTAGAPFDAAGGATVSETGTESVKTVTVTDSPSSVLNPRRFLRVRVSE